MMKIPRKTLLWLYFVFALKFVSIAVSTFARTVGWNWVPTSSNTVLVVALAFVLSSLVFLIIIPKLGLASTAAYGALTFYGATTSLFVGHYIVWSSFAALTGLALVGLAVYSLRQLSATRQSTEKGN